MDRVRITRKGFINTHPAYLPFNRGKHPYFWSIVEDTKFGVSIHWITDKIDDGDIIDREEIEYDWLDYGETLYNKAREEMIKLFQRVYYNVKDGEDNPFKQDNENSTFHYGYELEPYCVIDLDREYKARDLINIIRGRMFSGKGNSYFCDGDKKYYLSLSIRNEP